MNLFVESRIDAADVSEVIPQRVATTGLSQLQISRLSTRTHIYEMAVTTVVALV